MADALFFMQAAGRKDTKSSRHTALPIEAGV